MIPGIAVTDFAALREWLETSEHEHECAAWGEGLYCCLHGLLPPEQVNP